MMIASLSRFGGILTESHVTYLLPTGEFVAPAFSMSENARLAPQAEFALPRLFLPPPVPVYSDPNLVPSGATEQRVVLMRHGDISTFRREATVDFRDIRFIHTLSEGRAGGLVAEKVDLMRMRLSIWRDEGGPEEDPAAVLSFLTRGNRSGTRDQLMVGRLKDEGEFYLLNGHRRVAALCVLASRGEIPHDWLTRLPVWVHEIANPEAIQAITAGVTLDSEQVLSEIVCKNVRAAQALLLLEGLPRRKAVVTPLPLARRMSLTAADHRLFLDLAERGGVDASLSQVLLRDLKWIATKTTQQPTNYEPFLERVERLPHLHGEILRIATTSWSLFRELAAPLYRTNPEGVTGHLRSLLSEEPLTRSLLADIHIVAKRLGETKLIEDLKRFRYHPNSLVREFALSQSFGDSPGMHAAILHHAAHQERDHQVLHRIELTLQGLMASYGSGFGHQEWGTPQLWLSIAFWLRRMQFEPQAARACEIAENIAQA